MRIGLGFDAHRLVPGRPLVLGGVTIPHHLGLLGHSDADVLAHAIGDALLGAAAAGDLGTHFPDSDPAYKNISSLLLLEKIAALVIARGFRPVNVDATIVAEKPRLAPHIPAMKANLAAALGLPPEAVNVKATTTEQMGFAGRGEGLAAYAVALVEKAT
jgi:2-C-methyl-D-erythritol 2,4-cyclodiphosphate synthase